MKAIHLLGIFIILQQCILLTLSVSIAQHRRRRQLPCTHPLRLSAPELFTHCSSNPCTYGSWSSWERVSGSETNVPQSQCESGRAYTEERTRSTTGSGCNQPVREKQRKRKHNYYFIAECHNDPVACANCLYGVITLLTSIRFTISRGIIDPCIGTWRIRK